MSKALKCDRCGTLYDYVFKLYHRSYFVSIDCQPYEDKRLDLCPTCQKELVEWFDKEKETE